MLSERMEERARAAKARSDATSIFAGGPSITQQQFKEESDINVIVERFGMTGQLPVGSIEGVYGDFTDVSDYESAIARIERAHSEFEKLPAHVRERFENDPARLMLEAPRLSNAELQALMEPPNRAAPVVVLDAGGVVPPVEPAS